MIMKKITVCLLYIILYFAYSFDVSGSNIVYPYRAVPVIVERNSRFEILYNNLNCSPIDSVVLIGPFNRIRLNIDSVRIGKFVFDMFTMNDVNNMIFVNVPITTPEELYDLAVFDGGEIHISRRSVKVLSRFNRPFKFIHMSDPHVSRQWVGTPEEGYAKELELLDKFIEVANIISPDFVIVTGDIIHHYTLFDADSTGWGDNKAYDPDQRPLAEEKFKNYYEGAKGFKGIQSLNAPVFSLPGNHDSYGVSRKDNLAMAKQWNKMCGKRVYGFLYADAQVFAIDDYLGDPVVDIPNNSPMSGTQGEIIQSFLDKNEQGLIRIMAQHKPDRIDTSFLDKNYINILLNGHRHNPFHEYVGKTPTLSSRPGTVCRSGEIGRWQETLGFFRIFYINGNEFEFTEPLRFCKNPTDEYDEILTNLSFEFSFPNNGNYGSNVAVINNRFSIDLPNCRVRFIMLKGEYQVTGGAIRQVIQTNSETIIDVEFNIYSNSEKKIVINQKNS